MTAKPEFQNKLVTRGQQTRERILDAAEILFSQRGYDGTSLRDLAAQASVRMSLVHYHFGTKEQVLAAAVDRKLGLLRQLIQQRFENAERAGLLTSIDECVRAFISPFFEVSVDKSHELHAYVTMTSHLMSAYRLPEVKPTLMPLSTISEIFTSRMRGLRPGIDVNGLLIGTYLMEAALNFMVQDPGFLDDLSAHQHTADRIDLISDSSLRFFSAGLRALMGAT